MSRLSGQPTSRRLLHPLGGIDRSRTHQDQPPYTTPKAQNVVPTDGLTKRERIAQRPGWKRVYQEQIEGGLPIRLAATVSRVATAIPLRWTDDFDALPSSAVWDANVDAQPVSLSYLAAENGVQSMEALRAALDINTASPYVIEVDFNRPINTGAFNPLEIDVRFRYANASPLSSDGTFVRFYLANQTSEYTVKIFENGAEVATTALLTETPGVTGTLKVTVNESGVAKKVVVNVFGADRLTHTLTNANDNTKQRVGLRVSTTPITYPDSRGVATAFRVLYTPVTPAAAAESVVAVIGSNGKVFADNPGGVVLPGVLTQIAQASVLTIASDRRLMATDMLQKLYIADNQTRYYSPSVTVAGGGTVAGVWNTLGISVNDDIAIVIPAAGSAVVGGVYNITSATGSTLTIAGLGGTGNASLRIERAMKVYDPTHATQQLSKWVTTTGKGVVPHGCSIITVFNNSIWCAGDKLFPQVWYMSRRDNPNDFDFGASSADKARAISGPSSGQSRIGSPITALVPFYSDYGIIASAGEMWLMRGDPRQNGWIDVLSGEVGILDRFGWCKTPANDLIFLARNGLNMLRPSPNGVPESFSRYTVPDELVNIDTDTVEISMGFDLVEDAAVLSITPRDGTVGTHWISRMPKLGMWEQTYPTAVQPRILFSHRSESASFRGLLSAGSDGYVRRLDRKQFFDDAPALSMANKRIVSVVQYGPFGPAGRDNTIAAMLYTLESTLAAGSGSVGWRVYAASSAEQCIRATVPFASGVWSSTAQAARTVREQIQARGGAFIVELYGADTTGGSTWSVEDMSYRIAGVGPLRV